MSREGFDTRAGSQPAADGYKWRVLATVIFGVFMVILDTTVVNVAFQALRQEFGGDIASSQWILSLTLSIRR